MSEDQTGIPEGALGRFLHEVTIGSVQATRGKDHRDRHDGLAERDLQFQVAISGTASPKPLFEEVPISFDYALHYAPSQRESDLEYPHFTDGSQTTPAVGIHATVVEWRHDETNGSIIGAIVGVAAVGDTVAFTGVLHLTFQGFGALIEEDEQNIVLGG